MVRRWLVVSRGVSCAAVAVSLCRPIGAQVVRGRILQREGEVAVDDAVVSLGDSTGAATRTVSSKLNGTFRIRLDAPGSFVIRVRRLGFRPYVSPMLSAAAGDSLTYDIRLEDAPRVLPQVVIDAELERVRDLQIFGRGGRSIAATYITSTQIESVGKDARNYMDVMRGLQLLPVHIDATCVRMQPVGPCLPVYLDERVLAAADDEWMYKDTQFVANPNEIDHIALVRPGDGGISGELAGGALLLYSRTFVARQRKVLHRP